MTRKALLGQAFIAAGSRGLTRGQMEQLVGSNWSRRLRELEADGWRFRSEPKRFGRPGTFRWILLAEPVAAGETCDVPSDAHLFEPPTAPPANALEIA